MICFRDRTWCMQECGNFNCSRNFTKEVEELAIEWWGNENFPLAVSDFKTEQCGFIEKESTDV